MTRVLIALFLAGTVIASWLCYLAGYSAGQREQMRQTLRDIEVLRRAEDDRVQVDPRVLEAAGYPDPEYVRYGAWESPDDGVRWNA